MRGSAFYETQEALLRVLGLQDMKFIQSVQLDMQPNGELPQLTVTQFLGIQEVPRSLATTTERFALVRIEPAEQTRPPFDLDAACTAALDSVQQFIDGAFKALQERTLNSAYFARYRMDERHFRVLLHNHPGLCKA